MLDDDRADRFVVVGEIFEPECGGALGVGSCGLNGDGDVPGDVEVDVVIGEEGGFGVFALAIGTEELNNRGLGFTAGTFAGDAAGPAVAGVFAVPTGSKCANGSGIGNGTEEEAGFDGETAGGGWCGCVRCLDRDVFRIGEVDVEAWFGLVIFDKECLAVAGRESAERDAGRGLLLFGGVLGWCRGGSDGLVEKVAGIVEFSRGWGAPECCEPEAVEECRLGD